MAAILNLKVICRSNPKNNLKYEILDPKNPENDVLHILVGQMVVKLKLLKKFLFLKLKMAAILNLRVKCRSNPKNNLKYEILDPKTTENQVLHILVGQMVKKLKSL